MCWIIPLLVGLLSAWLGYLLGKRCHSNSETVTHLTDENHDLRAKLNECETQKAQFIADSEQLLAQHKAEADNDINSTTVASTETSAEYVKRLADSDIEEHHAYQSLLTKYSALKKDIQANGTAKVAHLSDGDVERHAAYVKLKQQLEKAENDYTTLKTEFDESDQHNAQNAALISDLRSENQRIAQSLSACEADLSATKSHNGENTGADNTTLQTQIDALEKENQRLSDELKQCHVDLSQASVDSNNSNQIVGFAATHATTEDAFDAAAAKAVFGKKIKENDLTLVEGIGPKISQLFIDAGISTWRALGETAVADCQKVLDDAGDRYTVHNPGTWPRQAKLAADGEWQKLFDWQEKLDGGRE